MKSGTLFFGENSLTPECHRLKHRSQVSDYNKWQLLFEERLKMQILEMAFLIF
jgi:hypothetical protein